MPQSCRIKPLSAWGVDSARWWELGGQGKGGGEGHAWSSLPPSWLGWWPHGLRVYLSPLWVGRNSRGVRAAPLTFKLTWFLFLLWDRLFYCGFCSHPRNPREIIKSLRVLNHLSLQIKTCSKNYDVHAF